MRFVLALGLLLATCGTAWAQDRPPTSQKCAAAYGAFAQEQAAFGASDSLMGERYFNYAKIKFDDRLAQLAGKSEMGVTDLKSAAAADESDFYMKLVDAETDGDMDVPPVRDMIRLSDTCDAEYGFSPSLGGG
ncbi:MAG TPA: hypothetical protein VIJ94_17970 [Caulobacteraceae bacterium]